MDLSLNTEILESATTLDSYLIRFYYLPIDLKQLISTIISSRPVTFIVDPNPTKQLKDTLPLTSTFILDMID